MGYAIYYYSGTGNSLHVAKTLKALLPDAECVPIISLLAEETAYCLPSGTIGFVYPVYMNAVPQPVRDFINRCDFGAVESVFAVATHGGVPGKAGAFLSSILEAKGRRVNQYFSVKMINNTPKGVAPKPLMRLNWENEITEEQISTMKIRVDEDIKGITKKIISGEPVAFKAAGFWDRQLWRLSKGSKPRLDFLLDSTCTGCGTCEKVCLSGRVSLRSGIPQWKSDVDCYYCYACFNYCPMQAIGVKHYEKKMGRYHHPMVSAEDIAGQKKRG